MRRESGPLGDMDRSVINHVITTYLAFIYLEKLGGGSYISRRLYTNRKLHIRDDRLGIPLAS